MTSDSHSIGMRIQACLDTIQKTAMQCDRDPKNIHLLAVSKNQSVDAIQSAFNAGLRDFGESYWQEAQKKQHALQALPITWHFIGPIQSNKAKSIATHFEWVHSVSSIKIADKLNQYRAELPPLNICVQINIDAEDSKSGASMSELLALATHCLTLPHLTLRGLMIIPKNHQNETSSYNTFLRLKQLKNTLSEQLNTPLDTLSMGMSHDFVPAIRAGSTYVRIGRSIFSASSLY